MVEITPTERNQIMRVVGEIQSELDLDGPFILSRIILLSGHPGEVRANAMHRRQLILYGYQHALVDLLEGTKGVQLPSPTPPYTDVRVFVLPRLTGGEL